MFLLLLRAKLKFGFSNHTYRKEVFKIKLETDRKLALWKHQQQKGEEEKQKKTTKEIKKPGPDDKQMNVEVNLVVWFIEMLIFALWSTVPPTSPTKTIMPRSSLPPHFHPFILPLCSLTSLHLLSLTSAGISVSDHPGKLVGMWRGSFHPLSLSLLPALMCNTLNDGLRSKVMESPMLL